MSDAKGALTTSSRARNEQPEAPSAGSRGLGRKRVVGYDIMAAKVASQICTGISASQFGLALIFLHPADMILRF